jgi:flagellar basal body-associated protein FliL
MKTKKAMSGWVWIIIVIILILIGLTVWMIVGGDGGTVIGGNNIPTPPPLPE